MTLANAFADGPDVPYRPRVRFGAIAEGWGLFLARWPTWVLAGLVVLAGNSLLLTVLHDAFGVNLPAGGGGFRFVVPPAGDVAAAAAVAVVNGFFLGGMFRLACLQIRGRPAGVVEMFRVADVIVPLAVGSALWGAAVALAASLCFLPALVVAGVWMFMLPLIVDARLGPVDALGVSWRALKGQWLSAAVFHAVACSLAGMGWCLLCVGIVFTMPLYCLSIAVLYRDFFPGKGGAAPFPGPGKPEYRDPDF